MPEKTTRLCCPRVGVQRSMPAGVPENRQGGATARCSSPVSLLWTVGNASPGLQMGVPHHRVRGQRRVGGHPVGLKHLRHLSGGVLRGPPLDKNVEFIVPAPATEGVSELVTRRPGRGPKWP